MEDKTTRPLTEDDAWPEYPTRAQQVLIQIAEECFRKYPNNKELYTTDELKDAYKAGVIDGFKEANDLAFDKLPDYTEKIEVMTIQEIGTKYPEVKIICPRCKTLMPCTCNTNWDTIWKDFRANKNASYSWALLEYLRDNYNPPTKKQKNE